MKLNFTSQAAFGFGVGFILFTLEYRKTPASAKLVPEIKYVEGKNKNNVHIYEKMQKLNYIIYNPDYQFNEEKKVYDLSKRDVHRYRQDHIN